jgi:hypothetical protein
MRYVFSPRPRANLFVVFSSALFSRKTSGCPIAPFAWSFAAPKILGIMGGDVVLLLALLRVTADGQVAAFSGRCGKTGPCSCPYLRNPAARRHVITQ